MNGAERIARERARQIAMEGYTPEHDDEHDNDSLALAAACYAAPDRIYVQRVYAASIEYVDPWPWDWHSDSRRRNSNVPTPQKATRAERIRLLEKAGALIAAEIDRLLRASKRRATPETPGSGTPT